jgi:hypothetical protein
MTVKSRAALEEPRRKSPRLRLGIPALLETFDGTVEVDLVDLSQTGAKISLDPVQSVRAGVLRWLRFEVFGDIVWQDGGLRGIVFDEALTREAVLTTRADAPSLMGDAGAIEAARIWATGSYNDQTNGRAV